MVEEMIKKLLEAGVHFGHQTKRWNPRMKKFIFGQRSGIYIIDLEKTVDCIGKAKDFLRDTAAKGGKILFIGTKKQAQSILEDKAKECDMYYITNRWLGGLLTNYQTVKKSIDRLKTIEKMEEDGVTANLKKKELARLAIEKEKLLKNLGGIRTLGGVPDAVIIVDPKREEIAVKESVKLGIPVVALIDTNCDPTPIDYPIPGNDDAQKSINLIVSILVEGIVEGRRSFLTAKTIKEKDEGKKDVQDDVSKTETAVTTTSSTTSL